MPKRTRGALYEAFFSLPDRARTAAPSTTTALQLRATTRANLRFDLCPPILQSFIDDHDDGAWKDTADAALLSLAGQRRTSPWHIRRDQRRLSSRTRRASALRFTITTCWLTFLNLSFAPRREAETLGGRECTAHRGAPRSCACREIGLPRAPRRRPSSCGRRPEAGWISYHGRHVPREWARSIAQLLPFFRRSCLSCRTACLRNSSQLLTSHLTNRCCCCCCC